jgi:hypothetical protein
MTSPDKLEYKTTITDEHWRDEEFQWARILSEDHPAKGMVLLYVQKACTAFHEFFRRRLAKRIEHVLVTMRNNGLDTINGASELADVLRRVESAENEGDLAELTEKIHLVNHTLLDALEGK